MRNDDKLWREWEADVDQVLRSQIEGLYRDADEAEDTSSPEFLERMNELLGMEEQERPKRTHRRKHAKVAKVAGVAALFALLIGVSQMNPNADWSFGKLFEKVYDEFTLSASDETVLTEVGPDVNNQIAKQFPGIYVLTKLPEGFELISKKGETADSLTLTYSDGNVSIIFQQNRREDIAGDDKIDKDAVEIIEDGNQYLYYEKDEDGVETTWLQWKIGDTEFYLLAPYGKSSLVEMAQSVTKLS